MGKKFDELVKKITKQYQTKGYKFDKAKEIATKIAGKTYWIRVKKGLEKRK